MKNIDSKILDFLLGLRCEHVFYQPKNHYRERSQPREDGFNLSDEKITEITEGLREIGESENKFYRKNVNALKAEHDKYETRIKKMYEDKLDGRITDEMYDDFLKQYKEKQAEILGQMQDHSDADEQFYLTANMTLNIAKRAKEIFMSSEIDEKRQFLGFLLQSCSLNEKKLEFSLRSPFNLILNQPDSITVRATVDAVRTWYSGLAYMVSIPELEGKR